MLRLHSRDSWERLVSNVSFVKVLRDYDDSALQYHFLNTSVSDVERVLQKERLTLEDYGTLLSPAARNCLEPMAERAHRESLRNFGYTMQLFTPMYIANYCENGCVYCGYNRTSDIHRLKLSMEEIREEGLRIAETGLQHVLVLTGESYKESPVSYIAEAISVLKNIFVSVSVEIYSLSEEEYGILKQAGVDGMTMFQETYDPHMYKLLHPYGPKSFYEYRVDTPERACKAGLRTVNIGALMGLTEWRKEAMHTGMHLSYLMDIYPDVELAVSTPRIRPCAVGYTPKFMVRDIDLVQYILALRLAFPRVGITVSSRESADMRNHLVRLGVTKMSAGVTTAVGGHTRGDDSDQFTISDDRSVADMAHMLESMGYQPIYKDWQQW